MWAFPGAAVRGPEHRARSPLRLISVTPPFGGVGCICICTRTSTQPTTTSNAEAPRIGRGLVVGQGRM
eukprot:scaffold1026_cov409-Prasinococcus_capsulatus_cf.AAC.22